MLATWEAKARMLDATFATLALLVGFVAPWPEVVAGMFFALAGGFVGMVVSPPAERLGLLTTIFLALFIGVVAGMAHPHLTFFAVNEMPIQLVMCMAGLLSRPFAQKMAGGKWDLPFGKGKTGA